MPQPNGRTRILRLSVDPTWRLALAWSPPRAKPSASAPPALGAVRLLLMTYFRHTDGHIVLGDTCYSFAQLDREITQYERALRILRHTARRLYAAHPKARAGGPS